ncbi:MAG TPA: serine/threonine-protein kinase [Solirubrobacterales bacterium]|nr:serine/threonine-protein kinase [Solirubrobacterales bacterium]
MDPVNTLKPGERLGDFEIIRQLGRGGMGVVYLVRDERLGRKVALKVIAPDLVHDREFQERFEAEARSAAAIEHPNAVPIYSAGSADGNLYIAMRYIEGTDLREHLAESGRLDPVQAAAVVAEVGAALDASHAAGFVHRDVKPANILLTGPPGEGTAFLTDFGLTRGLGGAQTQLTGTGKWIGTLDYVAPEQMAAGRVDARTDIYSLGCVLYEMLSGSVPFTGDEMQKLWGKANEEPPPLLPGGRHPFDPVLRRAIARDPEHRFRSAGDLGRAAATAAGTRSEAPTERSVATGVAAAGLPEAEPPHRRALPGRPHPYERPTTRMPVAEPRGHGGRSAAGAIAIVLCALAVAAGLVAGALVLAGDRDGGSTVVTRAAESVAATASAGEGEPVAEASVDEEPAEEPEGGEPFFGNYYSATIPAGWIQEEEEAWASDGSYIENTWVSPAEDEALKVDQSPGDAADPAASAAGIAADLESAGNTVYSVRHGVTRGGLTGSEIAFSNNSGLPERVDFFFTLGDNGFAVMGSTYDIDTSRRLVNSLVASLELVE